MSADLKLRLPIIKTISSKTSDQITDGDDGSCISEEDCHTPKSPRHMIPATLSCPPAPRKPPRRRPCKRRLCDELQFFEIVAGEEVESFFRRVEENINGGGATKRRCVM
ncbi:hypothetical protein Pfo_027206 [Paulownia fortunei]|nr:hypothetical protein Pfo_027206 [Paulownia fortunei]